MVHIFWKVLLLLIGPFSSVSPFYHSEDPTLEYLELWKCTTEAMNDTCLHSSGADRYQVHLLWAKLMYSNNRNLKCYLACMYAHAEFLNSHEEFVGHVIVRENDNITLEEVEICDDITRYIRDKCEKTIEFSYCLTHTTHTAGK